MFSSLTAHCTEGGVTWPPSSAGNSSSQAPEPMSVRKVFLNASGNVTERVFGSKTGGSCSPMSKVSASLVRASWSAWARMVETVSRSRSA